MRNLFQLVKEIKETPEILGKLLREKVEIENKLQQEQNPELVKSLRAKLVELDIRLKELRCRQQSNIAVSNIITSLLNAGKTEDAKVLLENDVLERSVLKVLEVRKGKSAGTVRAWCEERNGKKVAVYAKNEIAKTLTSSVGKQIEVTLKKLDKGLFAVKVNLPEIKSDSKKQKRELIKTLYQN